MRMKRKTMIKLKSLIFEEENKYPADAPDHFGGGENLNVFGYQTKHFDICKSATTLYEKLIQNEEAKELVIQTAKDFDHLFEMEKQVVAKEEMDHDPIKHAVELCNTISFKLGRIAEITGHGDEEEDTHFIQMHTMVIISRSKQPTNENLKQWFQKGGKGGTTSGGWDRYGSDGQKLGKCGDGKKGGAYAACLSAEKAAKLGKKGRASFVRRKRAAQKKAGDAKKGGEKRKGQRTTKVKTGT